MELISKFENMPFQDVGTFNSIFKTTPLLGFNTSEEVKIKSIIPGKGRLILVGGVEVFLDLSNEVKTRPVEKVRISTKQYIKRKNRRYYEKKMGMEGKLPRIFNELTPFEFFAFHCVKKLKETTVSEICKELRITNQRTVNNHIKSLVDKGYVKFKMKGKKKKIFYIDTDSTTN
jgi:DNA-binding MarR family transcriptional regulator